LMADVWFLPDSDILRLKNNHALLEYASLKWADHLRDSAVSEEVYQAQILPLLSWFLTPGVGGNNYQVWQSIYHAHCKDDDNCAYQTPFYNAIVLGLQHVVRTLLPDHLPHINTRFHNGWTPLTAALTARQEAVARFLLSAGADPNVCASEHRHNRLSPLHIAAENSMDEAVEILLQLGASVDARTLTGTTPFYRAARGGSVRILALLHDHGSDIDARTWDDWTAIIEATCSSHDAVVEKLLDWGADTTIRTNQGDTAYDFACDEPSIRSILIRHEQGRRLGQGGTCGKTLPYRMNS
jgi:ankyrin repeat protein